MGKNKSIDNMTAQNARKIERSLSFAEENFLLEIKKGSMFLILRVCDYSPIGLGAVVTKGDLKLHISKKYKCNLQIKGRDFSISLVPVHIEKDRIGFIVNQTDRRKSYHIRADRIQINPFSPPTAKAAHPIFFDQFVFLRVFDISPNGIGLRTGISNKAIFSGMILSIELHLPWVGTYTIKLKTTYVKHAKNNLIVGGLFLEPTMKFKIAISEFLLISDQNITITKLKSLGFEVKKVPTAMFSFALAKEFNEILELRKRAYSNDKPFLLSLPEESFTDIFDEISRHIVYKNDGEIVAAARFIFNKGLLSESEVVRKYKARLSIEFDGPFLEVSKVCVDPSYRGTDLYIKILCSGIKLAYEAKIKFFLCTSESKRLPFYESIGYKMAGDPIILDEHKTILYPLFVKVSDLLNADIFKSLREYLTPMA